MKQLTLNIEDLAVSSFETEPVYGIVGTAHGAALSRQCTDAYTDPCAC
jgi:hypothetical protein